MSIPSPSPEVSVQLADRDHAKVEWLQRAVTATEMPQPDVSRPWFVWAHSLSRAWLFDMLERGAQVLVLTPLIDGGFAGLPAARLVAPPDAGLLLDGETYQVGTASAVDPTPAWQERGLF